MNDSRSGSGGPRETELCGVCGGDGRLENAWGQVAKCPSCHGNGRRREDTGFRDVTKTKPEHHQGSNRAPVAAKQTWPTTADGDLLAKQIRDAPGLTAEAKARLTREIIDHEATHGLCTKTFLKKIRKQFRPAT
ncbi:MAG TPA: molecular chaperone DnaJ [Labilithrix sp.]|jgi:hypothetical protein